MKGMPASLRLAGLALAGLLFSQGVLAQSRGEGGALYIAGDGFSLDQAIADAVRENPDGGSVGVIALRGEVSRLTVRGVTDAENQDIRRLQRSGASFYVCERDLNAAAILASDLLPGVRVESGWTQQELRSAEANGTVPAPRRIRRLCS